MAVIIEPASSNALQLGPSRLKQQIIGAMSNDGPRSASYRGFALRTARKRGEGRSSREVPPPGPTFAPTIGFPVLAVSDGHSRAKHICASMPGGFRLDLIVITLQLRQERLCHLG